MLDRENDRPHPWIGWASIGAFWIYVVPGVTFCLIVVLGILDLSKGPVTIYSTHIVEIQGRIVTVEIDAQRHFSCLAENQLQKRNRDGSISSSFLGERVTLEPGERAKFKIRMKIPDTWSMDSLEFRTLQENQCGVQFYTVSTPWLKVGAS